MSEPTFFFLSGLLVMSALTVILHPNPVRGALALVGTLFLLAVFFVFLGAQVVAALQVIVYAGAIMVLFLFVIMLLNLGERTEDRRGVFVIFAAGGLASLLAWQIVRGVGRVGEGVSPPKVEASYGGAASLARSLFTDFILPFELTSVLLLVAVIGAVVLAKRRVQ